VPTLIPSPVAEEASACKKGLGHRTGRIELTSGSAEPITVRSGVCGGIVPPAAGGLSLAA
jgi:hypothetical protein